MLLYFCGEIVLGCMCCLLLYYSMQFKVNLFSSICIFVGIVICILIFKMYLFPFWKHLKPVNFVDSDLIFATISKLDSRVFLTTTGTATYRIVAYYNKDNTTYVFKDEFYYNDSFFAKGIKNIIENEDIPKIDVIIEKGNMKKYKMKSCEYIVNLKYDFPEYFM